MKTPQEKLIAIMQLKHDFLKGIGAPVAYIYPQDIKSIKTFSKRKAIVIIDKIIEHLKEQPTAFPPELMGTICPFCVLHRHIQHDGCDNCAYGEKHGICAVVGGLHPAGGSTTWKRLYKLYNSSDKRPTTEDFLNILEE